jgi:hypothetical protein
MYEVEWLVDGDRYRKVPATIEDSNRFILKTDDLKSGVHSVAVRMFMTTSFDIAIVAHHKYDLKIKEYRVEISPFEVSGFVEKETLVPLDNAAVQNTDILRFTAKLKPVKSREPVVSSLFWQVYAGNGAPIGGLNKQVSPGEIDPEKEYTFRFRADNFSEGKYFVALTHQLASDPENRFQARAEFTLKEKIKINRALITDSKEKMTPKTIFHPGEPMLFYVYYDLDDSVKQVSISLSAQKKGGQVIDSAAVNRPKPGESRPYRVGFTIADGSVVSGEEGTFSAVITDAAGSSKSVSSPFSVVDYKAVIDMPETIASGKAETFTISLPGQFKGPYKVTLTPGNGLGLGHTSGKLTGTITGIASNSDLSVELKVRITDAGGKVAEGSRLVTIKAVKSTAGNSAPPAGNNPELNKELSGLCSSSEAVYYEIDESFDGDCLILDYKDKFWDSKKKLLLDKIKDLVRQGADINNVDYYDAPPLYYAAREGFPELVEFLLYNGADVNGSPRPREGNPLLAATKDGYPTPYCLYFDNWDNDLNTEKFAADHRLKVVKLLISRGADVNMQKKDYYGGSETPLYHAVNNNDAAVVQALLSAGANPDIANNYIIGGRTPYALAQIILKDLNEKIAKARLDPPTTPKGKGWLEWVKYKKQQIEKIISLLR